MKILHKIVLASIALGISSVGAVAQSDYYGISPFEGFYAGAYGGGVFDTSTKAVAGGIAGANFAVTDGVLAGVEVQAGVTFDTTNTYDALMLGRVGYEISDMMMVYGAVGTGFVNSNASYAIGGGAEAILVDQVGVRGEIMTTGAWGSGLDATKATVGLLWHLQN